MSSVRESELHLFPHLQSIGLWLCDLYLHWVQHLGRLVATCMRTVIFDLQDCLYVYIYICIYKFFSNLRLEITISYVLASTTVLS